MPRKPRPRKKPPRRAEKKLDFKRYEDIVVRDDEDTTEDEVEDEWNLNWGDSFPELDELNNIEDFVESFEDRDDDKYREP